MNEVHYKTSDGNAFYSKNAAENHAKSLKNRSIVSEYPSNSKSVPVAEALEATPLIDYNQYVKADLILMAQNKGLEVSTKSTKAQIIELINQSKKSE